VAAANQNDVTPGADVDDTKPGAGADVIAALAALNESLKS
jgi:hypothetical protein